MQPFECYQEYVAMKLHFNSAKYDYFKANGRTKTSEQKFENRNDKYFFEKLSKKYSSKNIQEFLLANLIEDNGLWIGDSFNDRAQDNYHNWKKRVSALSYNFSQEAEKLSNWIFEYYFTIEDGSHPLLLKMHLEKEISIETLLILDEILQFSKHWNKKLKTDLVWKHTYNMMNKYRNFLIPYIEVGNFKKILKEIILTIPRQ